MRMANLYSFGFVLSNFCVESNQQVEVVWFCYAKNLKIEATYELDWSLEPLRNRRDRRNLNIPTIVGVFWLYH